jgi:hypothetical protein
VTDASTTACEDALCHAAHLQSLGISLRSATEPIDDMSTGKLRKVSSPPSIGYLNAPRSMGKSLVHDPERAPLVRRAFENYTAGHYRKEQLLKRARTWGLTDRRGKPLASQAIGMLLRNRLYAGIVDVPAYGVRGKRGDLNR